MELLRAALVINGGLSVGGGGGGAHTRTVPIWE